MVEKDYPGLSDKHSYEAFKRKLDVPFRLRRSRLREGVYYVPYADVHSRGELFSLSLVSQRINRPFVPLRTTRRDVRLSTYHDFDGTGFLWTRGALRYHYPSVSISKARI